MATLDLEPRDEKHQNGIDNEASPRSSVLEKEQVPDINSNGGPTEKTADPYPHGFALMSIMVGILLSFFIVALDSTIIATAIPKITDQFHGLDKVSWYISAYLITFGGFQSTWGKIYKYYSVKISFFVAIFVFELGSLVCALAPGATALIVGRAIQGLGGAGIATGTYTIIAFIAEPRVRPQLTSLLGATYGIGALAGPLIGGGFTAKVSWRWCFWINLPPAAVSIVLIFFFFHMPKDVKPIQATLKEKLLQMDPVGTVLAMGAIVSFILAFQRGGQTEPWSSSTVIGLLVGVVVIFITFFLWEVYSGERAMIPARLFKQRSVWAGSAYQFFLAGAYFIVIYYLPIYFQSIGNVSPIMSGVRNIPLIVAATFGSIVGGVTMTKTGHAMPLMVIGAALGIIGAGLLFSLDIGTSMGKWIGYQIIVGAGVGLSFQCAVVVAQAKAKAEDISSATSIIFFFQTIGGSFSVAAAQSGFVNRMLSTLASKAPDINPLTIIATGATEIRSVFAPAEIPAVLLAYMAGIKVVFAISTGGLGGALLFSLFADTNKLHTEELEKASGAA